MSRPLSEIVMAASSSLPAAAPELKRQAGVESKKILVVLYNSGGGKAPLPQEQLKHLHTNLATYPLDASLAGQQTMQSMIGRFEALLIDVSNETNLDWFSRYRSFLEENPEQVTSVFIAPKGRRISQDVMAEYKNKYAASYVSKSLPVVYASKNDYVYRLCSDDVSIVNEEEAVKCCVSFCGLLARIFARRR